MEVDVLSRKVTYFLNQNVGTEKASATKVFSLLQDVLDRKNHLTQAVRKLRSDNSFGNSFHLWATFKIDRAFAKCEMQILSSYVLVSLTRYVIPGRTSRKWRYFERPSHFRENDLISLNSS